MSEQESRKFRDNLIEGLGISFQKLVEEKTRKGDPLAFAEKGEVVDVEAKDLKDE